jgi:atypical dual specificity phosphatase
MDTWWIDTPCLLGSGNPTFADLDQLQRDGFGVLMSLLEEQKQPTKYDVAHVTALGWLRYNISVEDFCRPTFDQLDQFVRLIAGQPPGAKVIVHCQGGIGKTGTFAAAYCIAKGMTVSDAIAHVRKATPHAVENEKQEAALWDFAARRTGLV